MNWPYARNTHVDQLDVVPGLLQVLLHQGQVIVFVLHGAKGEAISNTEDASYTRGFLRVELDVFKTSGIEMKIIPIWRKRLATVSIVRITIKDGQRIDRIVNSEAHLSQRDYNQYNDQNVATGSQDAF